MILDDNTTLIGLSGGVDSSVAALLLKNKGFNAIGLTITPYKTWDECKADDNNKSCCNYKSLKDSIAISSKIGIEHKFVNSSEDFKIRIVQYFIDEYVAGKTPNPCVECNKYIKWSAFLKKADELGAKYVATGHYAKINRDEATGRYYISKGVDKSKDQSYFLWELSQEALARTLFPLGDMIKTDTRKIAADNDLEVANKQDSQEICFIPDDDYARFLKENSGSLPIELEGDIIMDGKVIGRHKGYPFYTIGQRKGLGLSYPEPLYVLKIDPENNTIEVGVDSRLYSDSLTARSLNFMKSCEIDQDKTYIVKIRYKDIGSEAKCRIEDDRLIVNFLKPRRAITPGQSVVVYDNDDVVAGGIIE